ncbi:MAG: UDP-N-acetylglucosamine 1-carboxyvinyltransferase, partial [Deltaproteobacteria bacterium]|nr:UDP-N-acetylglucosamine 1-carboxyvinyltransferase [Deltaproteobacteria bacterium]
MDSIVIRGGKPLEGTIKISGAKNAALPLLCASLLADGEHLFRNVPDLKDVHTTAELLRSIGLEVELNPPIVRVHGRPVIEPYAPYELVKQMRASVLVLGPLTARYGRARVSMPGGCAIGARPIDQHLKGLEALGAEIQLEHGDVHVRVPNGRLRGADIHFDIPTVTGTENIMCAAALAVGQTRITNAAREPEVVELATVLNKMGASIQGAGTDVIVIDGVDHLQPVDHAIIPDRIEAGTYMIAAAVTGGNVFLEGARYEHVESICAKLRAARVVVEPEGHGIRVVGTPPFRPTDITTEPYPGFPTDMQAQFMLLLTQARGSSVVTETIFENRFMHVPELIRMGARIDIRGRSAFV